MVDRRLIKNFDWSLLLAVTLLSLIGVMTIQSATRPVVNTDHQIFYVRQLVWIGIGFVSFIIISMIDYKWFTRNAYHLFFAGVILLIAVLVLGREGMGAQRWLSFGFFSFQPSEFFKLLFIIALSRYLSESDQDKNLEVGDLLWILAVFVAGPLFLIINQPDLGTALLLFFIFIAMVLMAGVRKKIIVLTLLIGLISLPFVGDIIWSGLKEYQRHRLVAFFNPEADPQGIGYHIHQSKITIGSGGMFGKGYQKGTQGPLRFLPEKHTDFIFSIFAEEWGFIGSLLLFLLYLFVIMKGFDTVHIARDHVGALLAVGITFMFTFYFVVNISMTLGIAPVVGAPLPLVSYGGTALLSNFLALGLIQNIRMRRSFLSY